MIYEFGEFRLDTKRYELRRSQELLHLEPQVYAVLCYLLEHRDRVVTKDELLDQVWGHRFITPATLNTRIKALRATLDDDGSEQRVIRTVRGTGFRFVADVSAQAGVEPGAQRNGPNQHMRFCRTSDGVRIAYGLNGNGPPLVKPANWLTHIENDCLSPVWRHWVAELGQTHTFIRYDERGCGLSDHDVAEISVEAWVRDLEAVVDALRLERFPLLGISQGCAVAMLYAARHPERVSALVLYGGYVCGRKNRNPTPQQEMEAALLYNLIRIGWGKDNAAFRQVFGQLFVPEGTPEQWQWFNDLASTTPTQNALRIIEATYDVDVREVARSLNVPTLVLHARGDAMVPFEAGLQMAARIPGARFVTLEGNNHVLLENEPAWPHFLQEVRAFLRSEPQTVHDSRERPTSAAR
jgi:pimeloyl-ACP methyl ester carboxylesterase/DNA-binding winged helix-turn-helix (wHTH) protein